VPSKAAPPAQTRRPAPTREASPVADARSAKVYLFSRRPFLGVIRRGLSIAMLVAVDVLGLALGLYVALVLRTVLYGDTVTWALLWRLERGEWLPFLAPITVLVFLQAGLYARRERRSGVGRVVSSLVLVALIVLSFGLGTGYDFTTTGLIPVCFISTTSWANSVGTPSCIA